MAQLIYSRQALEDLERLGDFLMETDEITADKTINQITDAILVLEDHPYIGRTAEEEVRELIISRGDNGYVALYSFEEIHETILILAIRHQREAGYQASSGQNADADF